MSLAAAIRRIAGDLVILVERQLLEEPAQRVVIGRLGHPERGDAAVAQHHAGSTRPPGEGGASTVFVVTLSQP